MLVILTKDALLTNIFQQSSENFVLDVECKNSQLIVNCINKLHKKNLQTKLKAINELMSYLSKYDEATVGHFFPSFLSVYKKLIYHPNYNLRESLNMSLKIFIEKIKTKIKKHINVFLPPLFLSFFDYSKNVKQVSNDILSLLFPLKEDLDRGEEKSSEEKKKEKGNAGKIKLYNDNKLYLNVKKLNINITNFYNCLIYIKNDLDEEALGYIKNRENSDDYHKSVYLFNVLCFYPSLLYMIIKFCKMNILEECKNDLNNMEDKLINNNMNGSIEYNHYYNNNDKWNLKNDIYLSKVRDIFKIQYNNFSNTYNSFFLNINIIYKENKDDARLQKMLYLCVYNIIYLLKKIKINFMTLNNENVNESLCNYICSIINNKEEYIYKTINHLLLLLFFMDNRKIIKENFLKSYLSLVKQNKIYSNDVFNYNICLFLFLFKKEDIEEYFFFFFFLFYFLLLNNNKSCIVIYYDILLHLYDYFSFISIQQIQKNEKEGTNTIIKKDNINNKLYVDEKYCSYVLCLHILLLPLEMILIQKKLLDCNYSYKNKDLYENLINRYYCNKKKINPKKDVKEKDKFDDLRKKIKDTNIDEKHFLLTFINFINSSKNKNDIIFSSLDLISVYVNNMYDELNKRNQNDILKNHICNDDKNDKILKDENNKNNYNESYNITNKKNRSQSEYVEYYEVLHFLFQLFSEIKNVLFSTDLSCHENVIIITRNKYISTLKIIFINTFMLIKNNHYKLINIVKNNMLLFKFFFSHTKEEPPSPSSLILSPLSSSFSLIIIFDIINKILSDNNINKDIYFDSLNVGLNVLYMFFVMYNQSTYYIVLCEPVDEDKAEEKFKVCIDVLQFMRRENIKFLDLSYEILRIYYHYIMNKCKDEDLLKTFYELIYEDEKTNRNKFLFDRQFYIDLFYVHKEKMYLTQSLPDITFCSFFCKLVLENLITYDCRDDTTNKNNLYVYFLLLTLLRVDFNYDEKLVQLFMTLDKKILLRYMEVLRSIYKNCRDDESATYGNGRIEKNILHSIMDDPYDDNKDNEDNDDEKINETPNLMLYNNNNSCPYIKILEMIKKYVPDYLHFYIDNNFKLNVKNEIQYLNLFHHLIYISKYTSFNLYIYKSVQKALYESLQIISLSNYDIIFYSLEFVLRSPNYFSFFIENNMVTVNKENIFLNYSFYLKTYYKKIYDKYISVYKNKRIVLNNILSNTYNVQKNCIEHHNNKENIIKISQKNQKRNKIKNKQLYEYNKGVHFLRFMYELLEQHREVILFRNLVESKTFIQTLIKIIYFILSIYSCRKNNNMINERYKDICIKILGHMLKHEEKYKNQDNININGTKKINRSNNNYNNSSSCCFPIIVDQDNNSQTHLHAIYKIYLLSLKFCVTEYFEYFEGMNIFFNNVKNIHFDSIKKHEEKKILDIYINTYYLYILFSNMEKFKENKIFIDKTFSLLFLNCLFIKRLHDLKNEGNPIFQEINKYLCINNDTHNEFLYFIIEENMKRGEKNVEQKNNTMDNNNNDENNGHSGDEKSGHHNDDQKSGHHNDDQKSDDQKSGHHNDDQKSVHSDDEIIGDNNFLEDNQSNINEENNKIFKIEGKENDYTYDKLNNIYVEEVEHMSDSSLNLTDDDIVSNFLCFEKIKKKKMNDLKKKKKSNENGRYQVNNTCLDKNIKHENNSNNIYNIDNDNIKNRYDNKTCTNNIKTKKNKSLYFLKKSLKNPFLLIDINKNILDLYTFLLEMNYLKILLSMLNICLSSEYFIYDSDTYQQFLLFIESNNFNIFHFFKDIKEIDCCLIQKNDSLKNAKKTKVYIFFFSLYLTLLLITTYPNESIIIINQNKLYNIITFNQIIFSNLIINYQLNQLKIISTQYVNTTYSYDPLSKILSFKYKIKEDENEQFEDMTAKLTLTFLPNYPFSHFIISDKIESLGK
ncbi:hypothetical protein PFFCH_01410 [Plasmodium falciparum FCH/4]|uniref:E3 ubiquitin-protein ligase listerin n=1 Tax=Plasmodium falciparum FCH/4 TaxID=1036724 RepID=A0A024VRQ6_PLAFA|nr:hypothetical protein PFFCH_01410 [Plasmodium falciparum FCH/4]